MRTECAPPFYSVRICAHSVRMRTTTIFCAQCAQPLRTDILCCAHSVRILCACSPTSVRMRTDTSCAHSVRIAHRRLWKFYPLSVRSAPTAHRCAPLVHPPDQVNKMILYSVNASILKTLYFDVLDHLIHYSWIFKDNLEGCLFFRQTL